MIKSVCIRYTILMVVMAIITTVLAFVLERIFGVQWPNGANLGIVFLTAMITGIYCYDNFKEAPDKIAMWKLGTYFTVIQFAFAIIIMAILVQIDPAISALSGQLSFSAWASMIVFGALLILLLNRFGFSLGISQAKKKAEAKKDKE